MTPKGANQKDIRIWRLADKGLSVEQIARKLGFGKPPSEAGLQRVRDGLDRRETQT